MCSPSMEVASVTQARKPNLRAIGNAGSTASRSDLLSEADQHGSVGLVGPLAEECSDLRSRLLDGLQLGPFV